MCPSWWPYISVQCHVPHCQGNILPAQDTETRYCLKKGARQKQRDSGHARFILNWSASECFEFRAMNNALIQIKYICSSLGRIFVESKQTVLEEKKKKRKQQCTFLYDCSYHVIEPIDIHVHQLTAVMLEDLKKVYIKSPKYLLCTHILFTLPLFCSSNRNKRIHWNTLSLYIYKLPINIYPTSYWNNKCSTINLHVLKWQTHNSYNTGAFLMITSTCPWFMTVVSRCWQEIRICKNTDIVAENISVLWIKLQRNL